MPIEHEIRLPDESTKIVSLTPIKAIRLHCIECSQGLLKEVRLCEEEHCPLFPYRMGKNPCRTGIGNADHFKNHPHN